MLTAPSGTLANGPLTGIEPGEVALLNMSLPGKMKLSTGVMVLYADEESFTLMTPEGHMLAGWITFSALEVDGETVAQAQVLMRASDPIFELGLTLGGHAQEDRFWQHTLTQVARHFGHEAEVDTKVVCVDKRRQWSRWRNVWQAPRSARRSTRSGLPDVRSSACSGAGRTHNADGRPRETGAGTAGETGARGGPKGKSGRRVPGRARLPWWGAVTCQLRAAGAEDPAVVSNTWRRSPHRRQVRGFVRRDRGSPRSRPTDHHLSSSTSSPSKERRPY